MTYHCCDASTKRSFINAHIERGSVVTHHYIGGALLYIRALRPPNCANELPTGEAILATESLPINITVLSAFNVVLLTVTVATVVAVCVCEGSWLEVNVTCSSPLYCQWSSLTNQALVLGEWQLCLAYRASQRWCVHHRHK